MIALALFNLDVPVKFHVGSVGPQEYQVEGGCRGVAVAQFTFTVDGLYFLVGPVGSRLSVDQLKDGRQVHSYAVAKGGFVGYEAVASYEKEELDPDGCVRLGDETNNFEGPHFIRTFAKV